MANQEELERLMALLKPEEQEIPIAPEEDVLYEDLADPYGGLPRQEIPLAPEPTEEENKDEKNAAAKLISKRAQRIKSEVKGAKDTTDAGEKLQDLINDPRNKVDVEQGKEISDLQLETEDMMNQGNVDPNAIVKSRDEGTMLGGTGHDKGGVPPTPEKVLSPQEKLMADFQTLRQEKEDKLGTARGIDLGAQIAQALAKRSIRAGAAKATRAGGKLVQPGKVDFLRPGAAKQVLSQYKGDVSDLEKQMKLIKELQGKKAVPKYMKTKSGTVIKIDPKTDKVTELYKSEEDKATEQGADDPESRAAQEQFINQARAQKLNIDEDAVRRLTKSTIESKAFTAGIRKLSNTLQNEKESRLKDNQAWRIKEKEELTTKELEKMSGFKDIFDRMEEIRVAKKDVNTGKYASKFQRGREWIDGTPANFVKLDTLSGLNLFAYLKETSGVQFSDKERQVIESLMPNVEQSDEKFLQNLASLEDIMKKKLDSFTVALGQGKDDAWETYKKLKDKRLFEKALSEGSGKQQKSSAKPKSEVIQIRRKSDGVIKTISKDKADKYLSNPNFEKVE